MAAHFAEERYSTGPLQNQFNVIKVNKFGSRQKRQFCFEYQSYDLDHGTLATYSPKGELKKRVRADELKSLRVLDRLSVRIGFEGKKGYCKQRNRLVIFSTNADLESFIRTSVRLHPQIRLFRGDEEQFIDEQEATASVSSRSRGRSGTLVSKLSTSKLRSTFLGINSVAIQTANKSRWSRRFYIERYNKYGQPEGCMVLLSEKYQMVQLRRTANDEVISGYSLEKLDEIVQYGYRGRGISLVFTREKRSKRNKRERVQSFTVSERLAFQTAGARAEFLSTLKQQKEAASASLRTEKSYHPDAAIHSMMAGWAVFKVHQIKGMRKLMRGRRLVAVNVFKGLVHVFKSDDLPARTLTDKAEPIDTWFLGDESLAVSFEPVPKSSTRLRVVITRVTAQPMGNESVVASAPGQQEDSRATETGRTIANSVANSSVASGTNGTSVNGDKDPSSLAQYPLSPTNNSTISNSVASTPSNVVREVFDFSFAKASDVTKFQACIHGSMVMSKEKTESAWADTRSKVHGVVDAARCSAATLGLRAWSTLNQAWPVNKERLYIGTFNVGDVGPPTSDILSQWVAKPVPDLAGEPRYSMYVFCFQESATKFEDWIRALHVHLGPNFAMVKSIRLWEIALVVFSVQDQVPFISNVEWGSEATGIGIAKDVTGMQLGNKGAVAIGLLWHDVSMCFVSAHFVARQERVRLRNDNFQQVVSKLPLSYACGKAEGMELTHGYEHVFFCGDLNYRVDMDYKNAVQHCAKGGWGKLHQEDQLIKEMAAGRAFFGYETQPPNFVPTYRWARGKQEFSNKRDQPPSYTDRVLWRSRPGQQEAVKLSEYTCSENVTISDHRPVRATFDLSIRQAYSWPLHPLIETATEEEQRVLAESASFFSVPSTSSMKSNTNRHDKSFIKRAKNSISSSATASGERDELAADASASKIWYGHDGSFFLTDTEASADGAPEVRLRKIRLHLHQRKDGTQLPSWATLRLKSPILQDTEYTLPMPGSEVDPELIPEEELSLGLSGDRGWNDLYFVWDDDLSVPRLKPVLWDPCYLVTQHLRISVEHASPPPSNWYLAATAPRGLERGKKSTTSSSVGSPEVEPISRSPTRESDADSAVSQQTDGLSPKPSGLSAGGRAGTSASQPEGGVVVGNAAYLSKRNALGHVLVSFQNVVEEVRRLVTNYGISAWTRENSPCIPFAEPVMLGGMKVGEISGELQLLPLLPAVLEKFSRPAFTSGDPQGVLKLAKQGPARVQGVTPTGKRVMRRAGKGWHNVTLLLTLDGFLYVLTRAHPANSRKPPSKGVLEKLLLTKGNLQALPNNFKLLAGTKEKHMFSVSGRQTSAVGQSADAGSTYVIAVGSQREKEDWIAAVSAVQTAGNAVFSPQKSTANFFNESIPKLRSFTRAEMKGEGSSRLRAGSDHVVSRLKAAVGVKPTGAREHLGSVSSPAEAQEPGPPANSSQREDRDARRTNTKKPAQEAYVYSPPPPPPTPPHYLSTASAKKDRSKERQVSVRRRLSKDRGRHHRPPTSRKKRTSKSRRSLRDANATSRERRRISRVKSSARTSKGKSNATRARVNEVSRTPHSGASAAGTVDIAMAQEKHTLQGKDVHAASGVRRKESVDI